VNDNLANALIAALLSHGGLRRSCRPQQFGQVWWVDSNPPTTDEQTQLVNLRGKRERRLPHWRVGRLRATSTPPIQSMVKLDRYWRGNHSGGPKAAAMGRRCLPGSIPGSSYLATTAARPHELDPHIPGLVSGMSPSSVFASYNRINRRTQVAAAAWDGPPRSEKAAWLCSSDINWAQAYWPRCELVRRGGERRLLPVGPQYPPSPPCCRLPSSTRHRRRLLLLGRPLPRPLRETPGRAVSVVIEGPVGTGPSLAPARVRASRSL